MSPVPGVQLASNVAGSVPGAGKRAGTDAAIHLQAPCRAAVGILGEAEFAPDGAAGVRGRIQGQRAGGGSGRTRDIWSSV